MTPGQSGTGDPVVSVVITVHNGLPHIAEAVDSVLGLDFDGFEVVVIDDGSTDGTAELLTRREQERLRVVRRAHEGRAAALNRGLQLAKGRYVAILDADDIALPGRLSAPVRFLDEHPDVAVVGAAVQPYVGSTRRPRRLPRSDLVIRWSFLFRNPIFHSSATFRRDAAIAVGGYPAAGTDDAGLWLRLGRRHSLANLGVPLAAKRLHQGQHFASIDRRHRLAAHLACRWQAAHELGFPPVLWPLAFLAAAAGAVASIARIGLLGHDGRRRADWIDHNEL